MAIIMYIAERYTSNMRFQNVINQMKKNKIYTRKQVSDFILNENPKLSNNSIKWIISGMVKNNVIYNVQRGKYSLVNNTVIERYIPTLSQDLIKICKIIEKKYPLVEYVCFESIHLNEFLNHLIAKNTFFIYVEKEVSSTVFRYLREKGNYNVLYKPGSKEFDSYWDEKTIIILDLISECPRNKYDAKVVSAEHLLVDLICEKCITYLYSKSEIDNIYRNVTKTYRLDYSRLYRYARRRNKEELVKKIMKGVLDVN